MDAKYKAWLASPYGQVHVQAERTKNRKQLDRETLPDIWQCINSYLDDEDIYRGGRMRQHEHIRAIAAYHFRRRWNHKHDLSTELLAEKDKPVNQLIRYGRDVEQSALVSMVDMALKNYVKVRRTNIVETLVLVREAKRLNQPTIQYVADTLKIQRRGAEKRISKVNLVAKQDGFSPKNDIIEIERALKDYVRLCAWCEQPTPRQSQALCYECEERFYFRQDYPGNLSPDELQKIVNLSHSRHRQYLNELAKIA